MISVLLILLKIIGIVLLILLGIITGVLLLVLFVPVRYRFKGYYRDEFVCHGKVTWFLHLLSFSLDYENGLITSFKLLGIPWNVFKKKKPSEDAQKSPEEKQKTAEALQKHPEEKNKPEEMNQNPQKETQEPEEEKQNRKPDNPRDGHTANQDITAETAAINQAETISSPAKEETAAKNKTVYKIKETAEPEKDTSADSHKLSIPEKIRLFMKRIKQKISDYIHKIRGIMGKIRNIVTNIQTGKETIQYYISILKREEVKQAFSLCRKRIWILLKHILPKKMKVIIDYGFEDPAATGYTAAVYGMLPSLIGKKIIVHPDFNQQIFVCDFTLKGSVNAWSLLHQLLCIISDKNCRALYHIIKKEILNERK